MAPEKPTVGGKGATEFSDRKTMNEEEREGREGQLGQCKEGVTCGDRGPRVDNCGLLLCPVASRARGRKVCVGVQGC